MDGGDSVNAEIIQGQVSLKNIFWNSVLMHRLTTWKKVLLIAKFSQLSLYLHYGYSKNCLVWRTSSLGICFLSVLSQKTDLSLLRAPADAILCY